ncbi:zinc-finger homeodomain protein 2-like [Phaseolus vulgaris]|uniref:zinc-finger homeodomain protein 2-like n=1 Tax=Phaseolus vulgaris TaxID=3885 RepID=UPI0035CC03B2
MEFDDQEEQEEEMGMPEPPVPAPVASYDSLGNSAARSKVGGEGRKGAFGAGAVRYRECQKNHAVSFGGHAVDGCCEFMPAGEDGTLEAVICAACNCHRNFHRKEIDGEMTSFHHRAQPPPPPLHHHHQFSPYYHHRVPQHPAAAGYLHHHLATPPMAQHRPLALPAAASGGGLSREDEDISNPSSSGGGGGGGGGGGSKKRFRTKFTQEQKDKMLAFAEQLGWRIQKHDESAVEQFCAETNVERKVLKVWMHNNKNTLGKKP